MLTTLLVFLSGSSLHSSCQVEDFNQRHLFKRELIDDADDYDRDIAYCHGDGRVPHGGCRIHSHVTLPEGYDINATPDTPEGDPITVNFSINLANILAIDEPRQVMVNKFSIIILINLY